MAAMSKSPVTVFLCTGKDCARAWRRAGADSPGRWLKNHVAEAGLPYKLHIIKTDCMDRCEEAATLTCIHQHNAEMAVGIRGENDADRLLALLRTCVESSMPPNETLAGRPGA
jgi:hypothetical protein